MATNELVDDGFLYRNLLWQLIRERSEKISASTKFQNTKVLQKFVKLSYKTKLNSQTPKDRDFPVCFDDSDHFTTESVRGLNEIVFRLS